MAEIDQFDLFLPIPSEMDFLKADFQKLKDSAEKVRKKQFALIGEIKKMQIELTQRMELIEHNICRGV
jgi:hypothetical protein